MDDNPHLEVEGSAGERRSLVDRYKKPVVATAGTAVAAAGVYYIPGAQQAVEWFLGIMYAFLILAWSQGLLLSVLVGTTVYLLDNMFGLKAHTWFENWTTRPERHISKSEKGFIAGREVDAYIRMSIILGIGYMAYKIGFGAPDDEFTGGYVSLFKEYGVLIWQTVLVMLGTFFGFALAQIAGFLLVWFFKGLRFMLTWNTKWYEHVPALGLLVRVCIRIYQTINEWGHESNIVTDEERAANEAAQALPRHRSRLAWFFINTSNAVLRFFFRRRKTLIGKTFRTLMWLVLLAAITFMHELWQPTLVKLVNVGPYLIVLLLFGWMLYGMFNLAVKLLGNNLGGRVVGLVVPALLVLFFIKFADTVNQHGKMLTQYHNGVAIERITVADLPETVGIRVQALAAIRNGAQNSFGNAAYTINDPNFEMVDGDLRWLFTAEPNNIGLRVFSPATVMYNLPATETLVRFDEQSGNRQTVCFPVYQNGLFGRNAETAARRSLPWNRYHDHRPEDVRPMINDVGEPVLVISFSDYEGWLFRHKVFGGVVVIPQCQDDSSWLASIAAKWGQPEVASALEYVSGSWQNTLRRELTGLGTYISPEQIQSGAYAYLQGNQLQSEDAQRAIARSFRYRAGFWPVWTPSLEGDVYIADQESVDFNQMPHFSLWQIPDEDAPQLFGNFILSKQGSNDNTYELLIPGDGRTNEDGVPIVYVLDTAAEGMQLNGPQLVPSLVKAAEGETFWQNREVIEILSFKPRIAGEVRNLMMARVAQTSGIETIPYNPTPPTYVVDPTLGLVHKIKNLNGSLEEWNQEVLQAFGEAWGVDTAQVAN